MKDKILAKQQIGFLRRVGKSAPLANAFYLTGGTALAGFYLHHRYSEDLDFFSEQQIDLMSLNAFFRQIKAELHIRKVDFQQSYNRNLYFLHFDGFVLKTEFTFFPFPRIELGKNESGVAVDSLRDIAVNKLFTIYQRSLARDYIDLYCIIRRMGWTIESLVKMAKAKFDFHIDAMQLGTQFVKATQAADYPRMIETLAPEAWKTFFVEQAKKLKPRIIVG